MLSEPPSARDLRAIHELVTKQCDEGVGDAARHRLRAMHIVTGPPYELTARGRLLLAVLFAWMLCACGGAPFELAELAPDSAPLSAQGIDTTDAGVDGPAESEHRPTADAQSSPALEQLDARTEVAPLGLPLDAQGPDAGARDAEHEAAPDAHAMTDASEASARGDAGAEAGAADATPLACASSESFTYKTAPAGCGCETPPTYSCYSWGVVCGTCPADVDASPFGPSCGVPSACQVGAPCHFQALAGGVISGSVVSCP